MKHGGFSKTEVLGMSPREIAGWLPFVRSTRKQELGEMLSIVATGSQGRKKSIEKRISDLMKD